MTDERGSQVPGVLLAFLIGSVTGAALAILFAPRSGRETREFIANKVREGTGKLREGATSQRGRISAAFEAGKQAYREEKEQG